MKFSTASLLLTLLLLGSTGWSQISGLSPSSETGETPEALTGWFAAIPANDNCASPTPIFSGDVLVVDNSEATGTYGFLGCTEPPNAFHDLWFSFDYDGTGRVTITLDGDDGLSVDTYLAIADSCASGFFDCNNDANTGSYGPPYLDSQLVFECGSLAAGNYVFSGGGFDTGIFTVALSINAGTGCTNPSACNFDASAGCDDGSCLYGHGCIDPSACNYAATANCDDGSCTYPNGCTDPASCNFNPAATCDDGSCSYSAGCSDPFACNFDPLNTCPGGDCTYPLEDELLITTVTDNQNLFDGFMFNIEAFQNIRIKELGFELDDAFSGPTHPHAQIYFALGGQPYNAIQTDITMWELVFDGTIIPGGTFDIDAHATGMAQTIASGTVQGVYIRLVDHKIAFKRATNEGPVYASDSYLATQNGIMTTSAFTPGSDPSPYDAVKPTVWITYEGSVLGCMDNSACNYDSYATCDDGSCSLPDCTDSAACNYNDQAICDDGSCSYPDCIDPMACNFNPAALCDDNLCLYMGGCTDPTACNYDNLADCDDDSCILPNGCMDPTACNFDPLATCDDGSCTTLTGCTNPFACNYDPSILCDDGTCELALDQSFATPWTDDISGNHKGVMFNVQALDDLNIHSIGFLLKNFAEGAANPHVQIYKSSNYQLFEGISTQPGQWELIFDQAVTPAGSNPDVLVQGLDITVPAGAYQGLYIYLVDHRIGFRQAANPSQLYVQNEDISVFNGIFTPSNLFTPYSGGSSWDSSRPSVEFIYSQIAEGCTNNTACNYDATASCDDGSCILPDGCTDNTACNYLAGALCDDGSCLYPACTNPIACNYDPSATCDDGSCIVPDGCTDNSACNYLPAALCDDGSCIFPGCNEPVACNYDPTAGCDDGSCEFTTCLGCTFPLACNYVPSASLNDGSCEYASCTGCTYPDAPEYDPTATVDDGSCTLSGLTCPEDVNGDNNVNTTDLLMLIGLFGQDCTP